MKRDYYETLGVPKDAGQDEIKKAYRKLAMELHPDRNPGNKEAEERFKEATEAYSVLSDPEKRRAYDQFGHAGPAGGGQGFQFDPGQFAEFTDIQDIFAQFFGGGGFGGGRRQSRGERGSDLQYNLRIPFKDAVFGKDSFELEIPRLDTCGTCKGNGAAPGTGAETCSQCRGSGQAVMRQGFFQVAVTCPRCGGRGQLIPNPCKACKGEGRTETRTKVSFRIPAGVDRGTRVRLRGQGEAGRFGGESGDLHIVFDVVPDPRYTRDGHDLHQVLDVPWPTLVLGGTLELETLYGQDRIKVPAGTAGDHVMRLANSGVPKLQGSGRGDLFLHLRAAVPKQLNDEQRALVQQLSAALGAAPEEDEGFLAKVFGGNDKAKKKKRK
ncbi:MAG TPA: molecular chaperone DnaJ [Holophagaceae bacterium]|nr:molecular chaperone DnaJ [Holophagaceae bacterium]